MSKNGTSKVVRYKRDNLPPDKMDWAQIDAMTDAEVVSAALSDPDAQPLTPEQLAKMRRISRVKKLRQRLEHDPRFLHRIEQARKSLRAGRGIRLEDVETE